MATARPFAYNPGTGITGTIQVGNLAVGYPTSGFSATGLEWWMGADEDPGYVIAAPVPGDTQPTPIEGVSGSVGFYRSADLTESSFISISNFIAGLSGGGPFSTGTSAKTWLNNNGYWASFGGIVTLGLILQIDANSSTSYPGTGATAYDLTGSYNHVLTNAPYTVLSSVKCFDCNGSSTTIAVDGTGPTLPISGYTYISWAKIKTSSSSWRTLLRTLPDDHPMVAQVGTDNFGFYDNGSAQFIDSSYSVRPIADLWVQYAVVGDSSSSTFYINGSQVGNTIAYGAGGNRHWSWGAITGQPFGYVANLYLYNRKLSLSEITEQYSYLSTRFTNPVLTNLALYYNPANTLSYSGSGTSLIDLSGNGITGTLSNITFTTPYLSYNGTSSTTSAADSSTLEPGSGDWTIEVWVNYSVITGSSRCVMSKTDGGLAGDWGYGIRTSSVGATYMEVGNGTTSITSPTYTVSTNTWYQIVGVWTNIASNSIALYVNGVSQGSNSHSFSSVKNTTHSLSLGSFDNNIGGFGQWFNGKMGIVRMYNTALSGSQISQNFEANRYLYGI